MKELINTQTAAVVMLVPALAYVTYKLALEVWCIAYGLIY
jgi:hypothetical protein